MERNWWEIGEDDLTIVYDIFMDLLESEDDDMRWADDSAVWCEVFEGKYGEPSSWSLPFPIDWLVVSDFLNHWDTSDRQVYFKMFDWMCDRWKEKHDMGKHKVRHVTEVDYRHMTDEQLAEVYRLDALKAEWSCTCFDTDGDYYVCLKDMDGNYDDRGYAVYLKSTGDLLCLVADSGTALEGYEDFEYGEERNELYKKIAVLAGWPENMGELDVSMTWRQLIAELRKYPDEFLDTRVYVATNSQRDLDTVQSLDPWLTSYSGPEPGVKDDNVLFLDLMRNGE